MWHRTLFPSIVTPYIWTIGTGPTFEPGIPWSGLPYQGNRKENYQKHFLKFSSSCNRNTCESLDKLQRTVEIPGFCIILSFTPSWQVHSQDFKLYNVHLWDPAETVSPFTSVLFWFGYCIFIAAHFLEINCISHQIFWRATPQRGLYRSLAQFMNSWTKKIENHGSRMSKFYFPKSRK